MGEGGDKKSMVPDILVRKQIRFASPVADSHKKCNVFQVTETSRSKKVQYYP